MQAADIMTRAVITVTPNATITNAIRLMLSQRVSGLPVVDETGHLVGILTEGDLLRRAELGTERRRAGWLEFLCSPGTLAADYIRENGRRVGEVMTGDVAIVGETAPLTDIVHLMESKHVKRLPVVTDGRLVGVVSRADLLRALQTALSHAPLAGSTDETLQKTLTAELAKQPWAGRGGVTVTVTDRIVHLAGIIYDVRERDALRVAAENMPGVAGVHDQLYYVSPEAGFAYPLG